MQTDTDGPAAPIRVLTPDHAAAIVNFMAGLDSPELWHRFQRSITPIQVRDHYAAIDWGSTVVLGWHAGDGVCAIAEVILHDGPVGRQAEIAVTVKLGWRGRGVGELLLEAAIDAAIRHGARRCVMVVAVGDWAIPVLHRLGGDVDLDAGLATRLL